MTLDESGRTPKPYREICASDLSDNIFAESRCQLGTAHFLRGTVRTGSLVRVSPSGLAS